MAILGHLLAILLAFLLGHLWGMLLETLEHEGREIEVRDILQAIWFCSHYILPEGKSVGDALGVIVGYAEGKSVLKKANSSLSDPGQTKT